MTDPTDPKDDARPRGGELWTKPRRLPTTTINGKEYFIDERLKELRAVDNPHQRLPLRASEEELDSFIKKQTER